MGLRKIHALQRVGGRAGEVPGARYIRKALRSCSGLGHGRTTKAKDKPWHLHLPPPRRRRCLAGLPGFWGHRPHVGIPQITYQEAWKAPSSELVQRWRGLCGPSRLWCQRCWLRLCDPEDPMVLEASVLGKAPCRVFDKTLKVLPQGQTINLLKSSSWHARSPSIQYLTMTMGHQMKTQP